MTFDVAAATGLSPHWIKAIRAVESGGDPRAVRFEAHLFERLEPTRVFRISRDTHSDIAHPLRVKAWADGLVPYTPGRDHQGNPRAASSSSEESNRAAFDRAFKIDGGAAIRSTSFGSYQVLGGEFHAFAGHALALHDKDAAKVIAAFDADPVGMTDRLLATWINDNPRALAAAKRGDVAEWVHRFNGSSGASAVGYIARMRAALAVP